ncbi:hypothetical protein FB388_3897 [Pseudonocardia cypriaca]|uniref:Uncharacterized protein n=1 Tax=Pseudonocardia cypriaca TaxID=882449 RepID=A0A543FSE0_9PSEU|nr:hypothetical protein FB388_3897 [Pseudonocardia cypriaca]
MRAVLDLQSVVESSARAELKVSFLSYAFCTSSASVFAC